MKRIWAQSYSLNRPVPEYADGLPSHMFQVGKVIWCDPDQLRRLSAAQAAVYRAIRSIQCSRCASTVRDYRRCRTMHLAMARVLRMKNPRHQEEALD